MEIGILIAGLDKLIEDTDREIGQAGRKIATSFEVLQSTRELRDKLVQLAKQRDLN